jgi:hypothetical protein
MAISSLSLLKSATSMSVTGGTAMALSSDGVEVPNGVHVADMSELDFTVRTNLTLRTRNPVQQSDGSYSKAKRFATLVVPKALDDGQIVFNLVRIEVEVHPKTTLAEQSNLFLLGSQILMDADLDDFRLYGSLK